MEQNEECRFQGSGTKTRGKDRQDPDDQETSLEHRLLNVLLSPRMEAKP